MFSIECIHQLAYFHAKSSMMEKFLMPYVIVRKEKYNKHFLQGKMYASYSFINIAKGKKQSGRENSLKNMVELNYKIHVYANKHYTSRTLIYFKQRDNSCRIYLVTSLWAIK
jgi:hypothetical protein